MSVNKQFIYIDPSYDAFYKDKIFDLSNSLLNRDDQLLPFCRLRKSAKDKSCVVRTADYIGKNKLKQVSYYYSLG